MDSYVGELGKRNKMVMMMQGIERIQESKRRKACGIDFSVSFPIFIPSSILNGLHARLTGGLKDL